MGDFKQLVIDFVGSKYFVYALYIYLFAVLFYTVYCALNYFKYHSKMQKTMLSIYSRMSEQEKQRAKTEKQQRDIHGEGIKRDRLAKLDEELAYSGIKEKIKWMTTEIYIIINIVIVAITMIIATMIKGPWIGIISGFVVYALMRIMLYVAVTMRNKSTESIMLQFMNIVDNLSRTNDDLISILEKASKYIDEPLSTQIYDAVIEARNTGDTLLALQDLQDRVKNKHFKVLIRNLEISSRFETNYSDIIEDCREIFHNYLKSEKEKRNIRIGGLLEILTMFGCGFLCIYLIGDIVEEGNIIQLLLGGGPIGIAILGLLIVASLASLYIAVFKILRDSK